MNFFSGLTEAMSKGSGIFRFDVNFLFFDDLSRLCETFRGETSFLGDNAPFEMIEKL